MNYLYSSQSSLYVQWTLNADSTLPGGQIVGYDLYIDDGLGGNFDLAYSSVHTSAAITSYLITGLT